MDMDNKMVFSPIWLELLEKAADSTIKTTDASQGLSELYRNMVKDALESGDEKRIAHLKVFYKEFKRLLESHDTTLQMLEELAIILDKNYGIKTNNN